MNGIDFVEVIANRPDRPGHVPGAPRQRTLAVHLLHAPVPDDLDAARVVIVGGARPDPQINPVRAQWAYSAARIAGTATTPPEAGLDGVNAGDRTLIGQAVTDGDRDSVLVVRTSSPGDWSTYMLVLLGSGGVGFPDSFDEPLCSEPVTFTIDCPGDLDCRTDVACPPADTSTPLQDYLARDYAALRTRLLDRVGTLVPGWVDRGPADPVVTLAELFAAEGDRLAAWQDGAAAEATLEQARLRTSVRRHTRLLDYRVHEGVAARTWLAFTVDSVATVPGHTPVAAPDAPIRRSAGGSSATVEDALDQGAVVFETVEEIVATAARNALAVHAWGDTDACLPAGSTSAFLRHPVDADPMLAAGDVLILGPAADDPSPPSPGLDGQRARRQAVRLVEDPRTRDDPLAPPPSVGSTPQRVLEIRWATDDALDVPLPISVTGPDGTATSIAVALANVVLAEHAATLPATSPLPAQVPFTGRYRPRLPVEPVAQVDPVVDRRSAAAALTVDPRRAIPALDLDDTVRGWTAVDDLLGSSRQDAHVVVEPEEDGVWLRFGDGLNGARPTPGSVMTAWLRTGGGTRGNVSADVLTTLLASASGGPPDVTTVTNPLPALGGLDPEPLAEARLIAPYAYRRQLRAVTSDDYAAQAERITEVQRSIAERRWTGSWYAQRVVVDERGSAALSDSTRGAVRDLLDVVRMAGVDVAVTAPAWVPLEVVIGVCLAPGTLRADALAELRDRFSTRDLPDGRRGFFHPDAFTFGRSLLLADLIVEAMRVPGVTQVEVDDTGDGPAANDRGLRFRRRGRPAQDEVARGRIDAGYDEVLRADSDPSNPEYGRFDVVLRGGS